VTSSLRGRHFESPPATRSAGASGAATLEFFLALAARAGCQGAAAATLRTVSQVRVVTSFPNAFSMSVMKTGPRGPGT
jgi:hypothetical protein